jgi:hypothetical protein
MNMLNAGHTGLYGRQGAGLATAWQRALADEARMPDEPKWHLNSLCSLLLLSVVLLLSREPFAFKLPSAW